MRNSKLIALLSAGALVISSLSGLMMGGNYALADASAGSTLGKNQYIIPLYVSEHVIVSDSLDQADAAKKHLEDRGDNRNGYYKIKVNPQTLNAGGQTEGEYEIPKSTVDGEDLLVGTEYKYYAFTGGAWVELSKRAFDADVDPDDNKIEFNGSDYVFYYLNKLGEKVFITADAWDNAVDATDPDDEPDDPAAGDVKKVKGKTWVTGFGQDAQQDTFVIGAGWTEYLVFHIQDPGAEVGKSLINKAEDIELHVQELYGGGCREAFSIDYALTKMDTSLAGGMYAKDQNEWWMVYVKIDGSKTKEAQEVPGVFWFSLATELNQNSTDNFNLFTYQISNYAQKEFVSGTQLVYDNTIELVSEDRLPYGTYSEDSYIDIDRYEIAWTGGDNGDVVYRRIEYFTGDTFREINNQDMKVAFVENGNVGLDDDALVSGISSNIKVTSLVQGDTFIKYGLATDAQSLIASPVAEGQVYATDRSVDPASKEHGDNIGLYPSYFRTHAEKRLTRENLGVAEAIAEKTNMIQINSTGAASGLMVRKGTVAIVTSGINEWDASALKAIDKDELDWINPNINTMGYQQFSPEGFTSATYNAVARSGAEISGGVDWIKINDEDNAVITVTPKDETGRECDVEAVGTGTAYVIAVSREDQTYQNALNAGKSKVDAAKAAYKAAQNQVANGVAASKSGKDDVFGAAILIQFTATNVVAKNLRIWETSYNPDTKEYTRGAEITSGSIDLYLGQEKTIWVSNNNSKVAFGDKIDDKTMKVTAAVDSEAIATISATPGVSGITSFVTVKAVSKGVTNAKLTGKYQVKEVLSNAYTEKTVEGVFVVSVKDPYEKDQNVEIGQVFQNDAGTATYKVLAENSVELVKYNGTDTEVTVSTVDKFGRTWNVTKIGKKAFAAKTLLTKVTCAASVTEVDNGAFKKCSNLKNVTFEGALKSAGKNVFLKAGKKNGKKLTVKLADGTDDAAKKALKKSNKNAKIK